MGALTMVIGAGILSAIIIYFSLMIPDKHYLFKLLGFFFAIGFLIFIPKAIIDDYSAGCTGLTNVSDVDLNTTVYSYSYSCDAPTLNARNSMLSFMMYFVYLFGAYVFLYLVYYYFVEKKGFVFDMKRKIFRRKRRE